MKRRRIIALASAVTILGAGGAWSLYRLYAARTVKDVLPAFVEPGPGPRSNGARAFGFDVGKTTLAAVQSQMAAAGVDCPDTSIRAMMQQARADKVREIEAVRARGGDVDSVTGASMVKHRSPKEANPQVRLACADVASTTVNDAGSPGQGRLLLVFDSARHPLRHVSYERTYPAAAVSAALADIAAKRVALDQRFGPASQGPSAVRELMWLAPVEVKWTFADLNVRLSATHWGARGIVVSEVVEVPWPVRADAPAQTVAVVR